MTGHTLKPCLLHDTISGQLIDGIHGAFIGEPNPSLNRARRCGVSSHHQSGEGARAEVTLPSEKYPCEKIMSARLCGGNVSGRGHCRPDSR